MREILAIDCDDVIVETAPEIIHNYNETYGTNVRLSDFYGHGNWGAPDEDTAIKRVNKYLESDDYFALNPTQEAIDTIRALKEVYDLHIVTGRPDFTETATLRWLERHFPDIFQTVVFTNYFTLSTGETVTRKKSDVCVEIGASCLIDDNLHHAETVAAAGIEVLLFGDYPWNRTEKPLPANIQRVKGWHDVGRVLLK